MELSLHITSLTSLKKKKKTLISNIGFIIDALDGGVWRVMERVYSTILSLLNSEKLVILGPPHLSEPTGIFFSGIPAYFFASVGCLYSWLSQLLPEDTYVPLNAGTLTWLIILTGFFFFPPALLSYD